MRTTIAMIITITITEMNNETGEDDWNNIQSWSKKVYDNNYNNNDDNNNNHNGGNNNDNRDGRRRRVRMIGIIVRAGTRQFLTTITKTMVIIVTTI